MSFDDYLNLKFRVAGASVILIFVLFLPFNPPVNVTVSIALILFQSTSHLPPSTLKPHHLPPHPQPLPTTMASSSNPYTYESQNNALLTSLQQKTSQLKHVTLDIYDNARAQDTLDNTNEVFSSMSTNIKGSMGRMSRMARQGDRVAVFKLAAIIVGVVVVLWFLLGWIWGLAFGR